MKVNDNFGILIELVTECINDISVFGLFMFGWVIVISFIYILLGSEFENDDYDLLPMNIIQVLQTWRNSVGDLNPPKYPFWTDMIL